MVDRAKNNKNGGMTMKASGGFMGAFWFAGWLFTIGFAHLAWWKIILGIVVWPWFLGNHVVGY
jgi:hypothetical protein